MSEEDTAPASSGMGGWVSMSTLIHVGIELVVIGGVTYWLNRKINATSSDIAALTTQLTTQTNKAAALEETIKKQSAQITQLINIVTEQDTALKSIVSYLETLPNTVSMSNGENIEEPEQQQQQQQRPSTPAKSKRVAAFAKAKGKVIAQPKVAASRNSSKSAVQTIFRNPQPQSSTSSTSPQAPQTPSRLHPGLNGLRVPSTSTVSISPQPLVSPTPQPPSETQTMESTDAEIDELLQQELSQLESESASSQVAHAPNQERLDQSTVADDNLIEEVIEEVQDEDANSFTIECEGDVCVIKDIVTKERVAKSVPVKDFGVAKKKKAVATQSKNA